MTLNTARSPSDVYVMHLGRSPEKAESLQRWTISEVGGLDTANFVEPELIRYPTFDLHGDSQRKIPAFVYLPSGNGPFPVIIYIHGGPESQYRPSFSSTFQMWVGELGAAIVAPNIRGSLGYGNDYLSLDDGYKREDSVKDIGALLDWIALQPQLDQSRVAVYGGSYGGYMVLASAVHFSDRLKAAVDVVGISNFVTFLENTQDYRRELRRREYGDERDPQMRAFLQDVSPLNQAEKIKVPLLVVQGQNDPRVPVSESEQIVEALRERGNPVWYINALNEGHGYSRKENRDIYQQSALMFLQKYLIEAE
jgi:dipeptidyl aminopeptidase/acylaminoacyl peptidase